jgi:glycosyltransferase involved in cell wall biosynthesis
VGITIEAGGVVEEALGGIAARLGRLILHLHNRYRTIGGEERVVEELMWLTREHLAEPVELLQRDSAQLGRARAAVGLLGGGLGPREVARAVERTGARVVHAHNLNPDLGWRALAAAQAAGARTVLHLHNYRLVCAVGTCFTRGADCTRCHGRHTLPGVRLACRGPRVESAVYGAALALHQRRLAAGADAFVVPSAFALGRLRELGAPVGRRAHVIASPQRRFAGSSSAADGKYALYAGRLSPEKGVHVAIQACRRAGVPLVVAGDGPQDGELRGLAAGGEVRFEGRVVPERLAELRDGAALSLVPSLYEEIFPVAAAESMAAGVPTLASRAGGLAEFVPEPELVKPRDVDAWSEAVSTRFGDAGAGERALAAARERTAPEIVAAQLQAVYDGPA